MKILLVKPPNKSVRIIIPNLGLGYLASVLRQDSHDVAILDCNKEKYSHNDFALFIKNNKFDVIGLQVFTCDYTSTKKCLDIVKSINKNIITLIGGPHPSGDPTGTMNSLKNADFGFAGEAEIGLPKLINYIESNKLEDLSNIEGLLYRSENTVIINTQGKVMNLDDLPLPAWDLMDPNSYPVAPHGSFSKSIPTAPIITTRGCPYNCDYCAAKVNSGQRFRKRGISNVIKEIVLLKKTYGVNEIHIEDDNFTLLKPRVIEFCEQLSNNKIDINWACPNGVRLDTLDIDLLKSMENTGCYSFAVGIESGSERILKKMQKKEKLSTIKEKIELVANNTNIKMTGFFLMGYPHETKEDLQKTIDFSLTVPLDRAQFSNFLPLPGTEIYNYLIAEKKLDYDSINWDLYQNNSLLFPPDGITKNELRFFIKKAFFRFYFRFSIILKLLMEIKSPHQFITIIKRAFDSLG